MPFCACFAQDESKANYFERKLSVTVGIQPLNTTEWKKKMNTEPMTLKLRSIYSFTALHHSGMWQILNDRCDKIACKRLCVICYCPHYKVDLASTSKLSFTSSWICNLTISLKRFSWKSRKRFKSSSHPMRSLLPSILAYLVLESFALRVSRTLTNKRQEIRTWWSNSSRPSLYNVLLLFFTAPHLSFQEKLLGWCSNN